jgi:hypothetical protein
LRESGKAARQAEQGGGRQKRCTHDILLVEFSNWSAVKAAGIVA